MSKIIQIILCLTLISFSASAIAEKMPLFYTDEGTGEALVLIHAFPFDHQLWRPQRAKLKKHFRVITVDLWGFGQSGPLTEDGTAVSMAIYADEVKKLLDTLKIKKAIIAGESMGGYVSLAFLKKYPQYVSGLVLSDTQAIADTIEQQVKRETAALDILMNGPDKFIQAFLPKALSDNALLATRFYTRKMMVTQSGKSMASALRGMALREDNSAALLQTNVPVLILAGDQDAVISVEQSKHMHHLARNSRLELIKNAGHLSNLEQPQQWNNAVMDMFSR
jgi:pimeloyl-ACP methyl ester carboxylesterase